MNVKTEMKKVPPHAEILRRKRDQLAVKVMELVDWSETSPEEGAKTAFAVADAMIKESGRRAAVTPQPVNQHLLEALQLILGWRELRSGKGFPVERVEQIARDAIARVTKLGEPVPTDEPADHPWNDMLPPRGKSLPEMSRDELRSHIVELDTFIQRTLTLLPEVKTHLKRGYIAEDTWTLVNSVEALLDDIEQARGGGES